MFEMLALFALIFVVAYMVSSQKDYTDGNNQRYNNSPSKISVRF